jgi:hypothetical protein
MFCFAMVMRLLISEVWGHEGALFVIVSSRFEVQLRCVLEAFSQARPQGFARAHGGVSPCSG